MLSPDQIAFARGHDVTFVLTSCGRKDLLEQTLASFLEQNEFPLKRMIVIEDSDDESMRDIADRFPDAPLEFIVNGENLGQMASLDRLYARIDTEYVFHCEEDWEFSEPLVIERSLILLDAFRDVVVVWPRSGSEQPPWIAKSGIEQHEGIAYQPIDPLAHHSWGTFTLNPGLRRLSDYRKIPNGFVGLGGERAASIFYKWAGMRMVILSDGGVRHLGKQRSSHGAHRRSLRQHAKILGIKLRHRYLLLRRRLSGGSR